MFVYDLKDALHVENFNTVSMRGNYKHDAALLKNMMASGYSVEFKPIGFKRPSHILERNIVRTLPKFVEQLFSLSHLNKLSDTVIRRHYPLQHRITDLADVADARAGVVGNEGRRQFEGIDLKRHALRVKLVGDDS